MNIFQFIVVPILLALCVERLAALRRRSGGRGLVVVWALVWLGAALAVAFPRWTTNVANMVGIKRGADFVIYCGVIITFLGFFMCYLRMRRIEAELTRLVRQLAITNPMWPENPQ